MTLPSRSHSDISGSTPVKNYPPPTNPSGSNKSNATLPPKKDNERSSEGSKTSTNEESSNKEYRNSRKVSTDDPGHLEQKYRQELESLRGQFAEARKSYASKTGVLYPPTIAGSIVAFVIVFLLTTYAIPSIQESVQAFGNKFQFSLALSITAGIVPLIISAAVSSLKTEEQNDTLSALSFQIRNKRSDIAQLRQRQVIESSEVTRRLEELSKIKIEEDEKKSDLIRLLKSGKVNDFNERRKVNGDQPLNFKEVDLSKLYLVEVNFEKVDLTKADLSFSILHGCDLTKCELDQANLHSINIDSTILREASFKGATLYKSSILNTDLTASDLSDANLAFCKIISSDLTDAKLTDANLSYTEFHNVTPTNAKLEGAVLTGMELKHTELPISKEEAVKRGARVT